MRHSPEKNTQRMACSEIPAGRFVIQNSAREGTVCRTEIRSRSSQRIKLSGPTLSVSSGKHRVAPLVKGKKKSLKTASKERLINWATRSCGPIAKVSRCHLRKWLRPLWQPNTPLGTPEVPEVKKR